jgi:hypothetical protein
LYRDRDKALAHRDGKYRAIPACHRDNSLLTTGAVNRMASPVTQTPSIAVPLCLSRAAETRLSLSSLQGPKHNLKKELKLSLWTTSQSTRDFIHN